MNIFTAAFYAAAAFLVLLTYRLYIGAPVLGLLLASPLFISGAIVVLLLLDSAFRWWRIRARRRLRRAP